MCVVGPSGAEAEGLGGGGGGYGFGESDREVMVCTRTTRNVRRSRWNEVARKSKVGDGDGTQLMGAGLRLDGSGGFMDQ